MDIRATVIWPTVRQGGRPLVQAEIERAELFIAVADENEFYRPFADGEPIEPDGAAGFERTQTEVDNGRWFVRCVVTDKQGKSSIVTASIVVGGSEELSPPGPAGLTLAEV
jgi:hypothetical protein